jgi:hypothetical protein
MLQHACTVLAPAQRMNDGHRAIQAVVCATPKAHFRGRPWDGSNVAARDANVPARVSSVCVPCTLYSLLSIASTRAADTARAAFTLCRGAGLRLRCLVLVAVSSSFASFKAKPLPRSCLVRPTLGPRQGALLRASSNKAARRQIEAWFRRARSLAAWPRGETMEAPWRCRIGTQRLESRLDGHQIRPMLKLAKGSFARSMRSAKIAGAIQKAQEWERRDFDQAAPAPS